MVVSPVAEVAAEVAAAGSFYAGSSCGIIYSNAYLVAVILRG